MRTIRPITIAALLLPVLAGCHLLTATESFQNPQTGGVKQAAFELGCKESELQLTELGVATIGVSGCGKKAVYKRLDGVGWVNNTGGDDSGAAPKK